jgi:hypothetical protein
MLELEEVEPSPAHERSIAAHLFSSFVFIPDVFDVTHLSREITQQAKALNHSRSRFAAAPLV